MAERGTRPSRRARASVRLEVRWWVETVEAEAMLTGRWRVLTRTGGGGTRRCGCAAGERGEMGNRVESRGE